MIKKEMDTSESSRRIARNTLVLYVRLLFVLAVNFYVSRRVLDLLGVEDYGIYNVVGGFVALFSIFSSSLSSAISRFITFELGRGDRDRLKAVFASSVLIQRIMSLLVFVIAEILGVWFLNHKLNIPSERLEAAHWVLQCSILTFVANLLCVPYNATIIAHERMKTFAYVSILESLLKVGGICLLGFILADHLKGYALFLFILSAFIRMFYGVYSRRNFEECSVRIRWDKNMLKEMAGFAGWNYVGAISALLRDHGVNILLNLFCGPAVNAARGLSSQVNLAVSRFSSGFLTAMNPQITKSYAAGEREYMTTLLFRGAKCSSFLLLIPILPVLMETEPLLAVWLNRIPDHTVSFVRLMLIFTVLDGMSNPLITVLLASGKIRNYQILVGGLRMLNLPLSYLFLYLGFFPEITMLISIALNQCCLFARLYMVRMMIGLSVRLFLKKVYFNMLAVGLISISGSFLLHHVLADIVCGWILVILFCLVSTMLSVWFVGCDTTERRWMREKVWLRMKKQLFA